MATVRARKFARAIRATSNQEQAVVNIRRANVCATYALQNPIAVQGQTRGLINREKHEDARDFTRMALKSDFNPKAQAKRKKVEMLFANLKRILKLRRLRLRGPCGAKDEFTLAAIAQNLRKLAKLRPQTAKTRIAI